MKIILVFTFIITLSLDSFARMNPFESTNTFKEQKAKYLEQQNKIQLQTIKNEQKQLKADLLLMKKQNAKIYAQKEKLQAVQKKERKRKQKRLKEIKMAQKETFILLSFIKIEISNNVLTIVVNKKYKLLNQDILKDQKKILFDFKGNISFYTMRKTIKHKAFKSFAIGTHRKKNFFRVVIDLSDDVIHYNEIVNSKKGIITIKYL
jgi:hypothetical protein